MFFCLTLRAVYSALPQQSESIGAGPSLTSNSGSPASILIPSNNSDTSNARLKITCDGRKYGKNLKVPSCRKVFGYLSQDATQYIFVERDSGIPGDVPLPLRTYSNDGLCFVQPFLKENVVSGHASLTEIGQAAYTILQACVVERGMGGMASNIGGNNKINVAIAGYNPIVKCDPTSTPGPSWNSCVSVFANMKATKDARRFGYPERPGVEVELPLVLEAADGKCQASIDIDGPATIASWYGMWEAVTAIASMCTRAKDKGGKAKNLGLGGNIVLELSANKYSSGGKSRHTSTVTLAHAGGVFQGFESEQTGISAFYQSVPFELVAGVLQDNSSVVTLPGDTGTDDSAMASAWLFDGMD